MVVEANWGNFRAKFNGREQKAFEWLCSLLFYKEHRHPTGSLRYLNQAGIEADPITVDEEVIGWQAKFVVSPLSKYKAELIKAIDNAKKENPTLTRICFYLSVDFPPSSTSGVKDPLYKTEIEEHARSKGIDITWRTASFFETPFVSEENASIAKNFFSLEKNVIDFIEELFRHTEAILEPIRSEIIFDGTAIKIDRSQLRERLRETLSKSPFVIVTGEAGVGKTAVVKDLYNEIRDATPLFVFKATEFNVTNVNQLLKDYGNFTLSDLVQEFVDTAEKYIVIDSAEKLSDIEHPEVFQEFLSIVRSGGWKIVFTTRLSYLDDLKRAFIQVYSVPFEPLNVPNLTNEELITLSKAHKFVLPDNERLRKRLQNPFYLNEYLRDNPNGKAKISYAEFNDEMWDAQIVRSSYRKNNAHRKREECFLELARKRAASGHFFVTIQGSDEALSQLETDEIIKFDSNAGGYFITHDIYEEWALEKLIERSFRASLSYDMFYRDIGSSLPIRRAFRNWLSDKLASNDGDAKKLIEATVNNVDIDRHWKDETIVAALLSDYADAFIEHFAAKLLEAPEKAIEEGISSSVVRSVVVHYKYDNRLLHKLLFLLRIACKEVDQELLNTLGVPIAALSMFFAKPKGSGWGSVIGFLNKHKDELGLTYMHLILPVLDDWNRYNKEGTITKDAAQIALFYYNELTKDDGRLPYDSRDETKDRLIRTIFNGSAEITDELKVIFNEVVAEKDTARRGRYRGRYHELVSAALSNLMVSGIIAQNLPKEVIAMATAFWFYTPPKEREWSSDYRNDIEQYFDLSDNHSDHYPASAFQTPIFRLLQVAPQETVDFILAFSNRSIQYFAKSEFAKYEADEVEVFLDPKKPIKQYICHRIWNIYRGTQVAPTLLESMHMALERWLLLILAKAAKPEVLESWCLYLIQNSHSASITAVVASVVLAEPAKLFKVAQVLFRTRDFFFFDTARMQLDMTAKSTYAISHDPTGFFTTERLRTCEDKHRGMALENLALNYQLFRSEGEDEETANKRQAAIWEILDDHYAKLPDKAKETDADKTWRLYLARMDRRKMNITAENKDDKYLISLNPEIDPELKQYSEESLAKNLDGMKYTPLRLWGQYRFERNENAYQKYPQYENNYKSVITDTKAILQGLKEDKSDERTFTLFYHAVPAYTCAVLMRDYPEKLDSQEKEFCKNTILDYASRPLDDGYRHQLGDGINVAINVLPLLLKPFPNEAKPIKEALLFALFDSHPIGMNGRFFDYAVSAILQHMWEQHPADANALFLGYLRLKPKFDDIRERIRKENREKEVYVFSESAARQRFIEEHASEIAKVVANEIIGEEPAALADTHANTLVTAFLLLPLRTADAHHKKFVKEICEILAKRMLERDDNEERFDYALRHRFLEKLANFVLTSDKRDIQTYVNPFLETFNGSREAASIFSEFISAEDKLNQYDQFWTVWNLFYPKIVQLCKGKGRRFHSSGVVHNYLLAWPYWNASAKEWHSLKDRDKEFFRNVAGDIGDHPAVLYSLSKLLNEIGSGFVDDGIGWISDIFEKNPDFSTKELEVNTIYYLENLVRGYVLLNRHKIRTTPQIKQQILTILNFLLEKGSATAYLLREDIL